MTSPNDDEIRKSVEKLKEAAKKKAIAEATTTHYTVNSVSSSSTEGPSDEQMAAIEKGVKELGEAFEECLTPHPDHFDFLIDHAKLAEAALGTFATAEEPTDVDTGSLEGSEPDFALIDTAKTEIQKDWDGKLRNQLIDNYLTPMYPGIVGAQGGVARLLRQHAQLMQKIYVRRRTDAKKIADEGVTAMEAINDSKGSDLKIFLAVIGGLMGLGAAVAGPFMALTATKLAVALSTAGFAAGSAIGGNFIADDKQVPLGADTVAGVRDNIYQALKDSDKKMQDDEDELIEGLQGLEKAMYPMTMGPDSRKGNALIPMFPEITKVSDIDELKEGFTSYADDNGNGNGDGSGGRGSYKGPNPPDDFDGSVDDTSGNG